MASSSASAHSMTAQIGGRVGYGIAGGLAGGLVFGVLMQAWGMMPMVAQLIGSSAVAVGWVVHLAISAFIGLTFALVLNTFATTFVSAALAGAGYGVVWWVLGALIIMPARLGMDIFTFNTMAWQSLGGHLAFGLVLGLVYAAFVRREHG